MSTFSEAAAQFLLEVAIAASLLCVIVMVVAYRTRHLQNSLLYLPGSPAGSQGFCDAPGDYDIAHSEALEIAASDGVVLRGYLMTPSSQPQCTLIYFHGNAGNVGHRLPIARMFLAGLKSNVVMMDYRGYGTSDDVAPTEEGLQRDGQAVLDYVVNRPGLARLPIVLMGTSLGGAVAVHLAGQSFNGRHIAGLILENTFTSISDMVDAITEPVARKLIPRSPGLLRGLVSCMKPLVLFIGWYSVDTVRFVRCPTLFLSGAKDELVPASHVRALHDSATQSVGKRLVVFPTGKHNDLPTMDGYVEAVAEFIHDVLHRAFPGDGYPVGR